ncbi:MAG: right-handed parallel beta-helix repeat-containing protein [Dehalococcoidia bacterium]|jgi:hypothetical protein
MKKLIGLLVVILLISAGIGLAAAGASTPEVSAVSCDDTDSDGVDSCSDNCPNTYNPSQTDSDADSVGDACDGCDDDPYKTSPGICGCGVSDDEDSDGDGIADCIDTCDDTIDSDYDGTPDCYDTCDDSIDSDGDSTPDCSDGCNDDPYKTSPGICGCGVSDDEDSDSDGTPDCVDACPDDYGKDADGCPITEVWVDDNWAVNSSGDIVDGHIFGTDAFAKIQHGIDNVSGSIVHVAAGTYYENIVLKDGVELLGNGSANTTIDGMRNGSVITATDLGNTTRVDGFTVTNGSGTIVSVSTYGGGMYNSNSSPAVTNCTFIRNSAKYGGGMLNRLYSSPAVTNCTFISNSATVSNACGGGMYNDHSVPIITNCTFTNNSAIYGGGIANQVSSPAVSNCTFISNSATYGGGMSDALSAPAVSNCIFINNSASDNGGGMYNIVSSSPTVTNCVFSNNSATKYGGGIYNTNSDPTITNCTFTNNSAINNGGGMYSYESSPAVSNCSFSNNSASNSGGGMSTSGVSNPTITNCSFQSNSAIKNGGGIYNSDSVTLPIIIDCSFQDNSALNGGGGMFNAASSPTVTNCSFTNNSAGYGGGIHNDQSSPAVTNCSFYNNSASIDGGGMYNYAGSPTITNCTFANNSANSGGGMYNTPQSSPTITNCILWDDSPNEIANFQCTPTVTYCDVQGGYSGDHNIDLDPKFVNASGGDLHLNAGSPCIDAGNNSAPAVPATDKDGIARPQDGNGDGTAIVDMGAYEDIYCGYRVIYINGSNGTITGNASQNVSCGGNSTPVTAVPDAGYFFTGWSDGATANPRTDTNVQGNINVIANFHTIAGGGGGGGDAGPLSASLWVTGNGRYWGITQEGVLLEDAVITSEDGSVTILIPAQTKALGPDGRPIFAITVDPIDPPPAPEGMHILAAFSFQPSGATFSPGIQITIAFDPSEVAEGETVAIAFYNEATGAWETVTGTVANGIATFTMNHFTVFAVMAGIEQQSVSDISTPAPTSTAESAASSTNGSGGLNAGAWAGIAVGVILAILIIILLFMRWRRSLNY